MNNVVPQNEKGAIFQIQDAELQDKIVKKEKVTLAMITTAHMEHIHEHDKHGLGYPSSIKRLMESHGVYRPVGRKLSWCRPLDDGTITKMGSTLLLAKDGYVMCQSYQ